MGPSPAWINNADGFRQEPLLLGALPAASFAAKAKGNRLLHTFLCGDLAELRASNMYTRRTHSAFWAWACWEGVGGVLWLLAWGWALPPPCFVNFERAWHSLTRKFLLRCRFSRSPLPSQGGEKGWWLQSPLDEGKTVHSFVNQPLSPGSQQFQARG